MSEPLSKRDSKMFEEMDYPAVYKAVDRRVTFEDVKKPIKSKTDAGFQGTTIIGYMPHGHVELEKEDGFLIVEVHGSETSLMADVHSALRSDDTPVYATKETYLNPDQKNINRNLQVSVHRFSARYEDTKNSKLPMSESEQLKELKDYLDERDVVNLFEIQEEFDWARGDPSERLKTAALANLYGFSKDFRWNFFRLFDELGIAYKQFRHEEEGQVFMIGKPDADLDQEDAEQVIDYQREKVSAKHMHIGLKSREYDEDHPLSSVEK